MSQTFPVYSPYLRLFGCLILLLLVTTTAISQGTAFTYQGKLTDSGNPANGVYDLQFKLFDTQAVGTGAEHGPILTNPAVQVAAGIFTVTLDFSGGSFSGADRFLEIGVRPAGSPNAYTILSPRQQITSSPYAIQTLNAARLGGVDASNFIRANTNGDVGIGAPTPTAKLDVSGIIQSKLGPNFGEFRIGGSTVLSAASGSLLSINAGGFTNVGIAGNVGIGTNAPTSKLEIAAQDGLKISGFQPFLTLNDTNTNARSIIAGGNGDFGFYPNSFIGGTPAVLIKNSSGNVGIGTSSPQAKLQIAGVGTNGYTLGVEGNVTQNLANFGFPKAMIAVNKLGAILRCFNSTIAGIGATAAPCGFVVGNTATGTYFINFGFPVTDRFLMITLEDGTSSPGFITEDAANYRFTANANQIDVFTFQCFGAGTFENSPFTIIVF